MFLDLLILDKERMCLSCRKRNHTPLYNLSLSCKQTGRAPMLHILHSRSKRNVSNFVAHMSRDSLQKEKFIFQSNFIQTTSKAISQILV